MKRIRRRRRERVKEKNPEGEGECLLTEVAPKCSLGLDLSLA